MTGRARYIATICFYFVTRYPIRDMFLNHAIQGHYYQDHDLDFHDYGAAAIVGP